MGDVDMYARRRGMHTKSSNYCKSIEEGNSETCSLDVREAGTYQVLTYGYKAYQGVTLLTTHNEEDWTDKAPAYYSNDEVIDIPDQNEAGVSSEINVERAGDTGVVFIEVDIIPWLY